MAADIDHYRYGVTWSATARQHVAWVEEFPSLSCLRDNPQEALSGIRQQVADTLRALLAQGERVPVPKSASTPH
jgi:hypothetical protein